MPGFEKKRVNRDHLGNVRLSYSDADGNGSINASTEILSEKNYYPFGLEHKGYNNVISSNANSTAEKFKYNGVEYEESLGMNLYEMDVRSYDPAIARFTSIDPVTHFDFSTYSAFDNNPVFWADPSGADSQTIYDFDGNAYTVNCENGECGDEEKQFEETNADGLTNSQWVELSRYGGGGFDAKNKQREANKASLAQQRDNFKKTKLYLEDIITFLKRFAYNNAAKVASTKNKDRAYIVYSKGSIELNQYYAKPFFSTDEGGIFDENFIRGFRTKIKLKGYGEVTVIYQAGLEINDFSSSSDYITDLASLKGSPIELKYNTQTVGFILFESKQMRDKFLNDFYFSNFKEAKEKMLNGSFRPDDEQLKSIDKDAFKN